MSERLTKEERNRRNNAVERQCALFGHSAAVGWMEEAHEECDALERERDEAREEARELAKEAEIRDAALKRAEAAIAMDLERQLAEARAELVCDCGRLKGGAVCGVCDRDE